MREKQVRGNGKAWHWWSLAAGRDPAASHKNRKAVSLVRLTVYLFRPFWGGPKERNRHGGLHRRQVDHPTGARRSIWGASQDTGRVGIERNWATLRKVRPTRPIPAERRNRLGTTTIRQRPRHRLSTMVR